MMGATAQLQAVAAAEPAHCALTNTVNASMLARVLSYNSLSQQPSVTHWKQLIASAESLIAINYIKEIPF